MRMLIGFEDSKIGSPMPDQLAIFIFMQVGCVIDGDPLDGLNPSCARVHRSRTG